ncbi:unnamed protein product [Pleuronectes platessa]|uniref:Uncharacterized protein n=1 Tax=Pleuronectes platessa TaxID=8262 RepID=A0A9N7YR69_PLEPL|nr:unnamed protein product [Pleuronectes platessa]
MDQVIGDSSSLRLREKPGGARMAEVKCSESESESSNQRAVFAREADQNYGDASETWAVCQHQLRRDACDEQMMDNAGTMREWVGLRWACSREMLLGVLMLRGSVQRLEKQELVELTEAQRVAPESDSLSLHTPLSFG